MKLHVISLGCRMSVADGDEMSRPFLKGGFRRTDRLEEADAVLVNTCTVRQHAEDKALSLIGRLKAWKDRGPQRFLIVAGCAAERLGSPLQRRFPHIDLVVGARSIEEYPQILARAIRSRFDWKRENEGAWDVLPARNSALVRSSSSSAAIRANPGLRRATSHESAVAPARTPPSPAGGEGPSADPVAGAEAGEPGRVCACVTIMRGCNYACAYCVVPAVRGREIYRPIGTILSEAEEKIAAGAKEITLLGQTVNSYHDSGGGDFSDLLRKVDALPGLDRVRFMSPHPYYLNERMIAAMAECSKVCPHLHLPLQSGCDRILKRMRRNYTVDQYLSAAARLRAAVPGVALTTDAIAGFPGETENEFRQTLDALTELDPCSAYCFKFSARPGTEAAEFDDPLSQEAVEDRHRRLLSLIDDKMRSHLDAWLGRRARVLLEDERFGKTEYYFNAELEGTGKAGDMVETVVTGTTKTGLRAAALASPDRRNIRLNAEEPNISRL